MNCKHKIYLILTLFLIGCESDISIIQRNGLFKNKERITNNIQPIPNNFVLEVRGSWNNLYIFCNSKTHRPINKYLGKEIFLNNDNNIEYERDTYEYKDSCVTISSYYNNLSLKSSTLISGNPPVIVSKNKGLQIVQRWQRQ